MSSDLVIQAIMKYKLCDNKLYCQNNVMFSTVLPTHTIATTNYNYDCHSHITLFKPVRRCRFIN